MTLPRWTPASAGPRALVETWTRFIGALRFHEDGHQTWQSAVLADSRRRQARYDLDTGSSRKQGTSVL
jgi:predicted secreted Zn-dependent protease